MCKVANDQQSAVSKHPRNGPRGPVQGVSDAPACRALWACANRTRISNWKDLLVSFAISLTSNCCIKQPITCLLQRGVCAGKSTQQVCFVWRYHMNAGQSLNSPFCYDTANVQGHTLPSVNKFI